MKHKVFLLAVLMVALANQMNAQTYLFTDTLSDGQVLYFDTLNGEARVVRPGTGAAYNDYISGNIVVPASVTYNRVTYTVTALAAVSNYGSFERCTGLVSVTLPNTITLIDKYAFYYCSSLTSMSIPAAVTSIGNSAFSNCTGLSTVTIPDGVTSIGNNAFGNVRHIEYHGNATGSPWGAISVNGIVEGDFIYSDSTKHFLLAYIGVGGSVAIPSTVDTIGDKAFYGCSGLSSVSIPNTVTSIGSNAFYNCTGLSTVTIPDGVTTIGNNAFSNVRHIEYHGNATGSPWGAITINGITEGSFVYSDSTKHFLLAYIGAGDSVTIPSTVDTIGDKAFYGCSGLSSVIFGNSVISIGSYAFANCIGLTSLSLGNSVTSIGSYAFSGCVGLSSVTIPNNVTSIGNYSFYQCSGLISITLGNNVTSIGDHAFYGCSGLTSVTFGNNVTSIGSYAFYGCIGLSSVALPNTVTTIGNESFEHCSGLTSVTLGNSVTSIGHFAFDACSSLTSITIPDSVISIGNSAFSNCTALTSVVFNAVNCTNAGGSAYPVFYGCTSLTTVTFGNHVEIIPAYAFSGCSGLTTITIPGSVASIGNHAFNNCTGLTEIHSEASVAPQFLGNFSPFQGVSSTIPVYIPCGSQMSYFSRWSYFSNFIEDDGFTFTVLSNDDTQGSVVVLTQPTCQAPTAVFNAVPNNGYRFDHWSDNNTTNPRTLTLVSDTSIVAYFSAVASDTVYIEIHDTVYLPQYIYIHDTVYIHDTIVVGVGEVDALNAMIYLQNGQIVVEGAEDNMVWLYDAVGRLLATKQDDHSALRFDVPNTGTYLIKVGNHPARRIVVVR